MKIAICLSGEPRFTKESREHFNKHIAHVPHDLFIHSWSDKALEFSDHICGAEIEPCIDFGYKRCGPVEPGLLPNNVLSQLHSISESFKLALASDNQYDLYVRCRFDVFVGNQIQYRFLNKRATHMLPEGKNSLPRGSDLYRQNINLLPLPKDFFWVTNHYGAVVSSNLALSALESHQKEGIVLCPEDLIFHHFAKNNLKLQYLPNNISNGLYRTNHHHGDGLVLYDRNGPYKK